MRNARLFPLLMLGAVAGTAITGHAAESPKVAGQVTAVSGAVTVTRPEVTPQSLKFRDNLYWRDVVDARKDGIARVLLGGKTTVTVRELTRLELREEKRAEGIRYVADLVSGKVRASVARMLMRPGEQVEVWTWNAVASVRGTDFIVEAVERPAQAGAFGLLGGREVAQGVGDSATKSRETVVVTLSGWVAVSNPLAGTGRVELVGAHEAARVSGRLDPVRLQVSADQLKVYLGGLTPPRPRGVRSGDATLAVRTRVQQAALADSAETLKVFVQSKEGNANGRARGAVSTGNRGPRPHVGRDTDGLVERGKGLGHVVGPLRAGSSGGVRGSGSGGSRGSGSGGSGSSGSGGSRGSGSGGSGSSGSGGSGGSGSGGSGGSG